MTHSRPASSWHQCLTGVPKRDIALLGRPSKLRPRPKPPESVPQMKLHPNSSAGGPAGKGASKRWLHPPSHLRSG